GVLREAGRGEAEARQGGHGLLAHLVGEGVDDPETRVEGGPVAVDAALVRDRGQRRGAHRSGQGEGQGQRRAAPTVRSRAPSDDSPSHLYLLRRSAWREEGEIVSVVRATSLGLCYGFAAAAWVLPSARQRHRETAGPAKPVRIRHSPATVTSRSAPKGVDGGKSGRRVSRSCSYLREKGKAPWP